jgi:hypothetical protein
VNAEAALGSMSPDRLRVAVTVGGVRVPAWIILLLQALIDSASTELVGVTVAARDDGRGSHVGRASFAVGSQGPGLAR